MSKTLRSKTGVRQLYKEMKRAYPNRPQIAFFLQDWEDSYNVGAMFRIADCTGATELILTGRTPNPEEDNPMIPVTSMGHHRRIPFRHFPTHDEAAKTLLQENWSLIAVEVTDNATDYTEFTYPQKTCLILGNEGAGVYDNLLKKTEASVFIPQFGKARSLNVTHAATVIAYQTILQGKAN